MLAAPHAFFPTFNNQEFEQRNWLEISDVHGAGESHDAMQPVHLAHRFIKNGSDDASMGMRRRSHKPALQPESAHEALTFFVEYKLQLQSGFICRSASKAVVAKLTLFDVVSGNRFVLGHVAKMKQSHWKMQVPRQWALFKAGILTGNRWTADDGNGALYPS
jgi:hypothetical protein